MCDFRNIFSTQNKLLIALTFCIISFFSTSAISQKKHTPLHSSIQKISVTYKYSYNVRGKHYRVLTKKSAKQYKVKGIASWYGGKFHGRKTARGDKYNKFAMTAASKILPLGSKVKVTNLINHKTVVLTINDRGPFYKNRIIDLSLAAAKKLGFKNEGTASVEIKVLKV